MNKELNETNTHDFNIGNTRFKEKKNIEKKIQEQKTHELHFHQTFNSEQTELKIEKDIKLSYGGCLFIEVEQNGKPSGLQVTTAGTWIHGWENPDTRVLEKISLNITTLHLKELIETGNYKLTIAPNDDTKQPTKGYLIPLIDVMRPVLDHIPSEFLQYHMDEYLKEKKRIEKEIEIEKEKAKRQRLQEIRKNKKI